MAQHAMDRPFSRPAAPLGWFDAVRGVLTDPAATFGRLATDRPWLQATVFSAGVGLLNAAVGLVWRPEVRAAGHAARLDRIYATPLHALGHGLIAAPLALLALSVVFFLVGRLLGGEGGFGGLLATQGYVRALGLLTAPAYLVAALLHRYAGVGQFTFLGRVVVALVAIWAGLLTFLALRAALKLSSVRALLTLVIGGGVFAVLVRFVGERLIG